LSSLINAPPYDSQDFHSMSLVPCFIVQALSLTCTSSLMRVKMDSTGDIFRHFPDGNGGGGVKACFDLATFLAFRFTNVD